MKNTKKIADIFVRVGGIAYMIVFLTDHLPMVYSADDKSVYTIMFFLSIIFVIKGIAIFEEKEELNHGRRNKKNSRATVRRTGNKISGQYRKNRAS